MVLAALDGFVDAITSAPQTPTTARGLDLADKKIDEVVRTIGTELDNLNEVKFENSGHIAATSFGGGDRAPALALHHTRAHGVIVDTLKGVRADLIAFQRACREAREAIADVDQTAADDLRAKLVAVDSLRTGSWSDRGEEAYEQAQHDHADDRPADDSPADESGTEGH